MRRINMRRYWRGGGRRRLRNISNHIRHRMGVYRRRRRR